MKKVTKPYYLVVLLLITACAQKPVSPVGNPQAVVNPFFPHNKNATSQSVPSWLASPPSFLHGVGVHSHSEFGSESSFMSSFDNAIEDLNSNSWVVVTVESFSENNGSIRFFEELAIRDEFTGSNTVKLDSVVIDGYAYTLVAPADVSPDKYASTTSTLSFNETTFPNDVQMRPRKSGSTWYAGAGNRVITSNLYKSWAMSKQNALKELARHISLQVQTSTNVLNDQAGSVTYTKTRVVFEDVRVTQRWTDGEDFYNIVGVGVTKATSLN